MSRIVDSAAWRSLLRDLKKSLAKGRRLWWALLVLQVALVPLSFVDVVGAQVIIDKITQGCSARTLLWLILATGGISLFLVAAEAFVQYRAIGLAQFWDLHVKSRFLRRVLGKPLIFTQRLSSGEILYRLLNDSGIVPSYMTSLRWQRVTQAAQAVFLVALMLYYDVSLSFLIFALLPVLFLVMRRVGRSVRALQEKQKQQDQQILGYMETIFSCTESIKALGAERLVALEWTSQYRKRLATERSRFILERVWSGMLIRSFNMIFLLVLGLGGYRVITGALSLGSLLAFLVMGQRLMGPVQFYCNYHLTMQDVVTALQRARATWHMNEADINTPFLAMPKATDDSRLASWPAEWSVEVNNIHYEYAGAGGPVLRGATLELRPGQIYRLDGPNGSGKSTLLKIIARLLDPASGQLSVNGVPISQYPRGLVRQNIQYLTNRSFWSRGTIRENLCLHLSNGDMSPRCLEQVLDLTGCTDFIQQLPLGLDTPMEPRAENFSSGETQRLALARVLLRMPSVLLLDEALSSISRDSAADIYSKVLDYAAGRASVVLVHHGLIPDFGARRVDMGGGRLTVA